MTLLSHTVPSVAACPIVLIRRAELDHAERAIARRELVRVRRGVYASLDRWLVLKPWERYLARVHAVALTFPDVVFCSESAAVLRGLPVFGDPIIVHVLDLGDATSRLTDGIRAHTTTGARHFEDVGGVLATTRLATAVDVARSRHAVVGLSVADAALRAEPSLSVEDLVADNETRVSSRGRRHARWALHRASPKPETPLESVSRATIEFLGFDEPDLQVTFVSSDGLVDRVDHWWGGAAVVGEADGEVKYDGTHGEPADVIRREKARDRRLRERARGIAHWGWRDVASITPLAQSLTSAGLHASRPRSLDQLAGLRSALAPGR